MTHVTHLMRPIRPSDHMNQRLIACSFHSALGHGTARFGRLMVLFFYTWCTDLETLSGTAAVISNGWSAHPCLDLRSYFKSKHLWCPVTYIEILWGSFSCFVVLNKAGLWHRHCRQMFIGVYDVEVAYVRWLQNILNIANQLVMYCKQ